SLPHVVTLRPRSTLFRYTTLFRSLIRHAGIVVPEACERLRTAAECTVPVRDGVAALTCRLQNRVEPRNSENHTPCGCSYSGPARSEEHTSELQSRENLVCRLLLEK